MNQLLTTGLTTLALVATLQATEFHVATTGDDAGSGTLAVPFRTIQHAADLARPGDVITVHAGTYRERINPPRGGASDSQRIIYQAAAGEKVTIKGSEVVTNWVKIQPDVWQAVLPNSLFGGFNPFNDLIRGDWFQGKGRKHHTGAVYLNGEWLTEAASQEDIMKPVGANPLWFGQVDARNTTIWAQFKDLDPNRELVEINVRQAVFYPEQPGRNFITVRGFTMKDAATPWAPPTAEQIGLIGTHWSKGWIIENNVISHSVCSGIALGKHGDEFDNTSANSAEGYVKTIERAHAFAIPWTRENIGHHLVRNNTISHCEQAGIVGSMGAAFSTISGNTIHDIHVRELFTGCEQAGIKFHGAVDTEIRGNHIYRAYRGLWLDWMAQGSRVTGNLFHDNSAEDLYVEVNHGPFLVDNNLLLSARSLWDMSEGGAYVHNLLTGKIDNWYDMGRLTPHLQPHSTAIAGLTVTQGGDNRFFNNLFVGHGLPGDPPQRTADPKNSITGFGLWVYDARDFLLQTGGNVYFNGARPHAKEIAPLTLAELDPGVKLVEQPDGWFLEMKCDQAWFHGSNYKPVTTELLGKAAVPKLRYENADGSPLVIDRDYSGNQRDPEHPTPGPFAKPGLGDQKLKVW
jgi:alpha-N-arabinofuranosidase